MARMRIKRLEVRLTVEEEGRLREQAAAAGLPVSDWVREQIRGEWYTQTQCLDAIEASVRDRLETILTALGGLHARGPKPGQGSPEAWRAAILAALEVATKAARLKP